MVLKKRARSKAHTPHPQSHIKRRNGGPSVNDHEHTHDVNHAQLDFWSFPTTIAHCLALLSLLRGALLTNVHSLRETVQEYTMGLAEWWSSRGEVDGEDDGRERLALMDMERSEDDKRKSGRSASNGNGKEIKRRRHGTKDISQTQEVVYFPGMVNLSGTLCYMNSVLQAFASVTSLFSQLEKIVQLAVDVDLPTPVTDALLEVLYDLNTPQKRQPPALRPIALLHALQTLPAIRRLLSTREQQDAHELFLVLAEAVSDEALKVAAEVALSRGLGEILSLQGYVVGKEERGRVGQDGHKATREKKRGLAMPWEGLMARRRVCRTCGWCESIRMDTLGGMELAIPLTGDIAVEQCIAQYLAPEALSDVTCEMCSLRQTLHFYSIESVRLSAPPSSISNGHTPATHTKSGSYSALEHVLPNTNGVEAEGATVSAGRKKKAKEAKRVEARLREMVEAGTVAHFGESSLPLPASSAAAGASGSGPGSVPIKWQTARTDSVREAAITRPPQSLRLHFIRSEYTPYGLLLKKNARVSIPLVLDLTRFVANGVWEERNVMGMLNGSARPNGSTDTGIGTDTTGPNGETTPQAPAQPQTRVLYRLESVILHYGYNHSSGHYICIRRKPQPSNDDAYRPIPVRKSCPDYCACDGCRWFGQVREPGGGGNVAGKGWLRISDADVDEVGVEALHEARAAVFMVFYEKVGEYEGERDGQRIAGGGYAGGGESQRDRQISDGESQVSNGL